MTAAVINGLDGPTRDIQVGRFRIIPIGDPLSAAADDVMTPSRPMVLPVYEVDPTTTRIPPSSQVEDFRHVFKRPPVAWARSYRSARRRPSREFPQHPERQPEGQHNQPNREGQNGSDFDPER